MATGKTELNHRPNTLEQNKMVLSELWSRNKIEYRTSHELNKLFIKINMDNAPKHWKNDKPHLCGKQEKMPGEHRYGPVKGFPPGSWWGIRMDCSRDRVHIPFDSDIQDGPVGAVSLCTSHLNSHNDEDLGDCLTYTGSSYQPGAKSNNSLLKSYRSQVPLRLVRSYNLTNDFAPKTGYRYDGLYTVTACWIGVSPNTEKYYKFALTRIPDQEPPPWRQSLVTPNKTTGKSKKTHTPQSRCKNERFMKNLGKKTHPTVDDRDPSMNSRNRNETTKLSFDKSSNSNIIHKITKKTERNVQDSAIVTRCISMKNLERPTSAGTNFHPYNEFSGQNVNRILENPVKPTSFKLQNTNISIRTDLYDSSHNIQHETKRIVPMSFCRTYVTARNTRVVNHSNVGTLNLNSCGPCPREGQQESLIQSRSGVSKTFAIQSPSFESQNKNVDRSTPKINYSAVPMEQKMYFDTIETRIPNTGDNIDTDECKAQNRTKTNHLELRQRDKENSPAKTIKEIDENAINNDEDLCLTIESTSDKKFTEISEIGVNETREETTLREQRVALDSLSPEQMLKYIVKQKCHPTAKLLIGSVIGLAKSESKILRTYDSLMSRGERWNRDDKTLRGEKNESPAAENGDDSSIRGRSKRINSIVKDQSSGKSGKQKRVTKERLLTMRLQRTRVSKRLLVSEKKSIANNDDETSVSLRNAKVTEKIQQPFSKSTSTKNSKKLTKKRRSELANLVIDANIGPKIRGPRNRRLRGRNHIFSKKRYEMDISNCCGVKVKSSRPRIELTSTMNKRLTSVSKTRMRQSRYIGHKKILQKSETKIIDGDVKKTANNDVIPGLRDTADLSRKREKRTISLGHGGSRDREYENSNDSRKRLCRHQKKTVSGLNAEKLPKMVDAATQYTDENSSDAGIVLATVARSNGNVDREKSIKIEWIDLDDVKAETWTRNGDDDDDEDEDEDHDDDDDDHRQSDQLHARKICGSHGNRTNHEEREVKMISRDIGTTNVQNENATIVNVNKKISAFVAVNISESDSRIKKLRSIGFRPIEATQEQRGNNEDNGNFAAGSSKNHNSKSSIISRIADERYNKYTSEETTVVGYMDQHLRYQDIEEDVKTLTRDRVGGDSDVDRNIGDKFMRVQNAKSTAAMATFNSVATERVSTSLEDDSEIPWHGWKKYFKNKQPHWVGW